MKTLLNYLPGINCQRYMISNNLSLNLRKQFRSIFKRKSASAILLSFFMMTLLILVSLGVSAMVIRDVSTVRTVLAGTQALYAAEGMNELGLYALSHNLPGYEPSWDYEFSTEALASLDVVARGQMVPCEEVHEGSEWQTLGQNESVQIALFAQTDANGNTEKIQKFYVEFYVGDEEGNYTVQTNKDVLRWKILGMKGGYTEAISEYIPLDTNRFTPEAPSIFGSSIPEAAPEGYSHAKYYEQIGSYYVFHPYYSIYDFLVGHEYNYLVLTNVIQGGGDEDIIYFRLHAEDYEPVCEYIALNSRAEVNFGDSLKFAKTIVREGENLPVFDFVLYHTKDDNEEETDSAFERFHPEGSFDFSSLPWRND